MLEIVHRNTKYLTHLMSSLIVSSYHKNRYLKLNEGCAFTIQDSLRVFSTAHLWLIQFVIIMVLLEHKLCLILIPKQTYQVPGDLKIKISVLRNFILLIDIWIQGKILHNYSYSSGVQFAKCSFLMNVFFSPTIFKVLKRLLHRQILRR